MALLAHDTVTSVDLDACRSAAAFLLEGGSPGAALGRKSTDYEALYAVGHGLYTQGHYSQALPVFGQLILHEPMDPRFLTAVAMTLQMLGRHKEALGYHAMVAILDADDPLPTLHAGECLIGLEQWQEATDMLELALQQCFPGRDDPIMARAQALLALVRRPQVEQEGAST